jgi:hypothetical protein
MRRTLKAMALAGVMMVGGGLGIGATPAHAQGYGYHHGGHRCHPGCHHHGYYGGFGGYPCHGGYGGGYFPGAPIPTPYPGTGYGLGFGYGGYGGYGGIGNLFR